MPTFLSQPRALFVLLAALLLSLSGCGSSNESYVFTGSPVEPERPLPALSGTMAYQRLLPLSTLEPDDGDVRPVRLDFAHPVPTPIRFARVQLLDDEDTVLGETHTDATGAYRFAGIEPVGGEVKVRVLAETIALPGQSAPIRVQDNTNGNAPYGAESALVDLREIAVVDLSLPTGYEADGEQPEGTVRSSGPFACLDGILTGYGYFLAGGLKADDLPLCVVNWSEKNRPSGSDGGDEDPEQARAEGKIWTSSFVKSSNELFILGFREADTDEFDWHIMVHEFGHWVQFNAFRDDGFGGSHSGGERKDPRLAFSEGFGNALGGLALGDAIYKDSTALQGFSFSLECNLSRVTDPNPGWFSETTVQTVLYDLFDPKREEGGDSNFPDRIALPLSYFVSGLSAQSKSPALTTIFSFLAGLVQSDLAAEDLTQLLALLAFESPAPEFGLNSTDEFGRGESHNGQADSLPLYLEVDAWIGAGLFPLTIAGQPQEGVYNSLQGSRYLTFRGDGSTIKVTAHNSTSATGSIGIALFENGTLVSDEVDEESEEGVDNDDKDSTMTRSTVLGSTYVAVLINTSTDDSTTDISLTRVGAQP